MDRSLLESRHLKQFKEEELLGKGAYGCVVKALSNLDGMEYAIKKIRVKRHSIKEEENALREVQVMCQLQHPNIIRYHTAWIEEKCVGEYNFSDEDSDSKADFDKDDEGNIDELEAVSDESPAGRSNFSDKDDKGGIDELGAVSDESPHSDEDDEGRIHKLDAVSDESRLFNKNHTGVCLYIQMELCQKETLRGKLNSVKLEREEAYKILKQILSALSYLHNKNIVHGDLSPSNIFLDTDNNIKLADFGLAKFIGEDDTMMPDLGAHPYRSPGLPCKPNQKLDLYAVGIIFFELLHFFTSQAKGSQRFFAIRDLREKQEFPSNFRDSERDLILRLMKEEPSERPDLEEVINEVEILSSAEMK